MIRVRTNTVVSPPISLDAAPPVTTGAASPATKTGTEAQILDQVELSRSAVAEPEDRSKRIAALKVAVASAGYLPPSLPVISKLVSGALSRPD
jgi:hypothetical protein